MTTTTTPTPSTVPELLDEPSAGRLCGMSGRTLRRLSNAGDAPAPVKVGRLVRWSRTALMAWIARGCPKACDAGGSELTTHQPR